ncbi:hypothetical protein Q3C67_09710 [Enterococcus faecium]|nr:hypothetical protein [Enterococcus faecium]MDQ8240149.1 hypothetical protein [Enterococcus faecium]
MKKNEMFRDWEFRYRYIYRKRRTKKSKQRFLSALVSDIYSMRTDVTVIAYDTLAYRSKNIYVGDIEKAEKVICTYYDTPVHALGSYFMFDWKDQRKKTIYSILLSFILLFSLGWWGMMIYIFSARKKQAQFFYLTKTDLRGKTFNWQNANQIIALFR